MYNHNRPSNLLKLTAAELARSSISDSMRKLNMNSWKSSSRLCGDDFKMTLTHMAFLAPKPSGRRARKMGIDRKPRQAYSAKQLERLENEFKVRSLR